MAELASEPFVALPPHEGSALTDRLRRSSLGAGFDPDIVQSAPDSWTAMALVGAEVGCSLTVSSVAADPHVRFLRVLDETLPVYLRMAWRGDSGNPALPPVLALAEKVWAERQPRRCRAIAHPGVGAATSAGTRLKDIKTNHLHRRSKATPWNPPT